jgi:hypothetical protein
LPIISFDRKVHVAMHREVPLWDVKPVAHFEFNTCKTILGDHTDMLDIVSLIVFVVDNKRQLGVNKTLQVVDVPKVSLLELA